MQMQVGMHVGGTRLLVRLTVVRKKTVRNPCLGVMGRVCR